MSFPILAAVALALAPPQESSSPPEPRGGSTVATTSAVRATEAPRIDGRTDDAIWRIAPRASDFRQFEPRVDADPTLRTEFQVSYDDRNLYVLVRMFDPHPDSIMRALSRRDVRGPSDQVKLLIDSYDDKRSGFEFAVNPDGVKRDFAMSNDGNEDGSWNGIWDVATVVDSLGWVAEFRIPLSQLRYAPAESHTFGFGIWRDIERYKERTSWPLWSPTRSGISSQLGRLTGLAGISSERRVEATPYVVTKSVLRTNPGPSYSRAQEITLGGDVKVGITPNVTLDATVNPDFGQVEADPAVVNLTAFETFFSERRPFFVEGTSQYRFNLNCYIVVDCGTNEGLFYSRRIGRSPTLRDTYGDATTATATPIAAAAKLTGRTAGGLSFGLLNAVTPRVVGVAEQTVEPFTNHSVVSASQDFRGGESSISVIATSVNRSTDEYTEPWVHRSATTGGASFRHRFASRQYELAGQFAASRVSGTAEVLARTQQNGVHFYQQPGDDLEFDPTRTSLAGTSAQLKFGKYGGGITRFETSVQRQSAGFDVNDLGYLQRADRMDWSTWGALSFRTARGIYRWAQLNANHWETWNTSGTRLENSVNMNGHMGLNNNWDVHLGGTYSGFTANYCDRCTRGGPLLRTSGGFFPWGGFNTDSRQAVSGGMWVNLGFSDDGNSKRVNYSPYVNFRLSTRLQLNVGTNITRNRNDSQWFRNHDDDQDVTHHVFAHLDQRTVSMNVRLNYTATPDLTFEFYGAPFVSSGTYSDFRELSADPRAAEYEDRFQAFTPLPDWNTTFKFRSLRTNAVVRWEYRPGSTLFVVWAHGREASGGDHQHWTNEYSDLFSLHPNNTFLVKFAYWMNR